MIVIPMAGLSQRFAQAGYDRPKFMLQAHGRSVFAHAVGSFAAYFNTETFVFILRNVNGAANFVRNEAAALGIRNGNIVFVEPTRGQAETVDQGLAWSRMAPNESVTIFNIDTFRPGFRYPPEIPRSVDGYLEVFEGEGANWSYVRPREGEPGYVAETAEKRPISNLCCTGLYHFGTRALFRNAYRRALSDFSPAAGLTELYVAPLYNALIQEGRDVRYHVIPRKDVIFCGVPDEYEAFVSGPAPAQSNRGVQPSWPGREAVIDVDVD
jgi:hypothetical protein